MPAAEDRPGEAAAAGPQATVVGAGVVGVCCALALQADGFRVTLIDRDGPGAGCSHGNAGIIGDAFCEPVALPGTMRRVPGWLLDPLGPLALRWRYAPRMIPWLLRFAAAARPARVAALSHAIHDLIADSVDRWRALMVEAGAPDLIRLEEPVYAYGTAAGRAADEAVWAIRRGCGADAREMDGAELAALEPALAPMAAGGRMGGNAYVTEPRRAVAVLAALFRSRGGGLRRATVSEVAADHVVVDGEPLHHDRLVIAAGAFSKPFAAAFGHRVPLETERGYHITLPEPGVTLTRPVFLGEQRTVLTPLQSGLRIAGTVEFAGLDAPPDWRRARVLADRARKAVPGLRTEGGAEWMGHRPALPDTVPVIGPARDHPRVLFAFGHGHQGLMAAPMTARLIADMAADRRPAVDPAPFRIDRF